MAGNGNGGAAHGVTLLVPTLTEGRFRTPGGKVATMWLRDGTCDHNTCQSALSEDEYQLADTDAAVFVDVGAYIGSVGIGYAIDHPTARVIMVEPLPDNVELIRRNALANEVNVKIVAAAVAEPGMTSGSVRWDFDAGESGQHHRYIGNAVLCGSGGHQTARVDCLDMAALVALAGGHIDLLKIDCEGGEYDLFAGDASAVDLILGEYHYGLAPLVKLLQDTHHVEALSGDQHLGGFRAVRRAL